MSFLVRAIKRILDRVDEHMAFKLRIEEGHIPEAYLAKQIAKKELSPDLLAYEQKSSLKKEANLDGGEVDQLALYLSELKLDYTKQSYLEAELQFDGLTWRDLMDLDFKAFGSKILNNLEGKSVEFKKLVIVAHMKHQIIGAMRAAVEELTLRVESAKAAKRSVLNQQVERGESSVVEAASSSDVRLERAEEMVDARRRPLVDVLCIDEWLHAQLAAAISQAGQLEHEVETARSSRSRGVIEINSGPGTTGPLLAFCQNMAAKVYLFMETVDAGKVSLGESEPAIDDHITRPGHRYALRDFNNELRKSTDPVVMCMIDGMDYIIDNIARNSEVKATSSRSFLSYAQSPMAYVTDTLASLSHCPDTTMTKRSEMYYFFRDLKFHLMGDETQTLLATLNTIDSYMARGTHLGNGRLTNCYDSMHKRVLDTGSDKVRENHRCIFKR